MDEQIDRFLCALTIACFIGFAAVTAAPFIFSIWR